MNKLRKRFIVFNVAIIGAIVAFVAVLIFFASSAQMTATRLISVAIVMLLLVLIGSALSSKIAMKPIQASWQRQLDFTADASHELRTPLAVIQTNLELVMDNPQETVGDQLKWLDNMHRETVRMTQLVDNLLTLSRGDAGAKALEYSLFSLVAVAEETAALFRPAANQKGIDIAIQIEANADIQLWADVSRIRQLLAILVDNAVKYMGKPGCITIALSQSSHDVQVLVSDTGNGIEPEHLARIFDRFYRAGQQRAEGFGLGLPIAEWIAKEHGGSIRATSVVGKGACFRACFPAARKV